MSMLPLPLPVLLVWMPVCAVAAKAVSTSKETLRAASRLMFPLVLTISPLMTMSVFAPSVCSSTLPAPWAMTASLFESPTSVMLPAVVRSTM